MTTLTSNPVDGPLSGRAIVPGDKSIGHRSLMLAALASEDVTIRGLSAGLDNQSTLKAIEQLGVDTDKAEGHLLVNGVGIDGLTAPDQAIDCGNSGTTMRLLAGIVAGQSFTSRLFGDASLHKRPMSRIAIPLVQMGANVEGTTKADKLYPPLTIRGGGLHGITYESPIASAQVKSSILLAGLYAKGKTTVLEPGPSRDHTERMLKAMGAPIEISTGKVTLDNTRWSRKLEITAFDVPADPSSAAFIIAGALLAGCERVVVPDVCINRTRTGFLDILADMGAAIEPQSKRNSGGEDIADLVVSSPNPSPLTGTRVSGEVVVRAIDEIPILALVAAKAQGTSHFEGVAELRVKESDRIQTTEDLLNALGVDTESTRDTLTVHGTSHKLRPATVDSHGDHRIAMTAAIAGMIAAGPVDVLKADNVATSFPQFVETLNKLGARIEAS